MTQDGFGISDRDPMPGAFIRMVDLDGQVLGTISNANIEQPQALADHVSDLIHEHNLLVAEVDRLTKLLE